MVGRRVVHHRPGPPLRTGASRVRSGRGEIEPPSTGERRGLLAGYTRARHEHCRIDHEDLMLSHLMFLSLESSILPPVLYGNQMSESSRRQGCTDEETDAWQGSTWACDARKELVGESNYRATRWIDKGFEASGFNGLIRV
eukprot:8195885-Pyramimonas_sp.AAC.1